MSLTSLNFVLSQFESERYRYFIVYDEDNDPVFTQNDLIDQETAIAKLKNFFKDNNGTFTIKVFGKKLTSPKNKIEQDKNLITKFTIENSVTIARTVTGIGSVPGSIPIDSPLANAPNMFSLMREMGELSSNMKLSEKDFQHYREKEDLLRRIEQLEKENAQGKGMAGITSTISSHLSDPNVLMGLLAGLGGLFKSPQAVTPINGVSDQGTNERKAKLVNAVNVLMTNDPDFPENIEQLANLCTSKPEMYKLAVNYLKSM